jgi:very-short-patch-repair endonuclease
MPQQPVRLAEILKAEGVESQLELSLLRKIRRAGLPEGEARQTIIPGRKFEFDRVWAVQMVAVEVQGGVHSRMGHSTGVGIERDCEKLSLAAAFGWRVLPVTEKQIESGRAVQWIAQALGVRIDEGS